MNTEFIQRLRCKLQKRVRRIHSSPLSAFHASLNNFWLFLHSYPVLEGVFSELKTKYPNVDQQIHELSFDYCYFGLTEDQHAAFAYSVIDHCVHNVDPHREILRLATSYNRDAKQNTERQFVFYSVFVEPLYEYIDEHLDDQRAILSLLRRYKHKCEWFQRQHLQQLVKDGERKLALHLYEYLFDQGLEFSIEPKSASGEADLIAAQNSADPLIADAKIFDPVKSKDKSYILRGFKQIYTYTLDYNEPFGYLVIFSNSSRDLVFPSAAIEQSTPLFTVNNKTIFIVVIDVFDHPSSASKRGKLDPIEVTEAELTGVIGDSDSQD